MDAAALHDAIQSLCEEDQRAVARCVVLNRVPYEMTAAGMIVDLSALSPMARKDLEDSLPLSRKEAPADSSVSAGPPGPPGPSVPPGPSPGLPPGLGPRELRGAPSNRGGGSTAPRVGAAMNAAIKRLSRPSGFSAPVPDSVLR